MTRGEIENFIRLELLRYPGATVSFGMGGKHRFAAITYRNVTRKTFFPVSPSDHRVLMMKRKDIRRIIQTIEGNRQ